MSNSVYRVGEMTVRAMSYANTDPMY